MTNEAQRIAIAEACGCLRYVRPMDGKVFLCREAPNGHWTITTSRPIDKLNSDVPDYPNDLNAMHEAEQRLIRWDDPENAGHYVWKDSYGRYIGWLAKITDSLYFHPKADSTEFAKLISATAAQRCEAFLRTLNLWNEDKP